MTSTIILFKCIKLEQSINCHVLMRGVKSFYKPKYDVANLLFFFFIRKFTICINNTQ